MDSAVECSLCAQDPVFAHEEREKRDGIGECCRKARHDCERGRGEGEQDSETECEIRKDGQELDDKSVIAEPRFEPRDTIFSMRYCIEKIVTRKSERDGKGGFAKCRPDRPPDEHMGSENHSSRFRGSGFLGLG